MSNPNSTNKLQIDFIEEDDGTGTIHIEWDDADPDLQWWTDLGKEGQKSFILDALQQVLGSDVN
jgi:hypothetical protein